jgi:hypothetical protein
MHLNLSDILILLQNVTGCWKLPGHYSSGVGVQGQYAWSRVWVARPQSGEFTVSAHLSEIGRCHGDFIPISSFRILHCLSVGFGINTILLQKNEEYRFSLLIN